MLSWAGNFNLAFSTVLLVMLLGAQQTYAQEREPSATMLPPETVQNSNSKSWGDFREYFRKQDNENYKKGLSYIISGSSAVIAGFLGERSSADPIDKGIYTTFQVIGIASVGYGAFKWKIEDEDKLVFNSLESSKELTPQEKVIVMENMYAFKKKREKQERVIKAITHVMAAALNAYGASVQSNETVKSGLFFLTGVNFLAAVSYTF